VRWLLIFVGAQNGISCHLSRVCNYEVDLRFLENLCTPEMPHRIDIRKACLNDSLHLCGEDGRYTTGPTFIWEDGRYTTGPTFIWEDGRYTTGPTFIWEDGRYTTGPTFIWGRRKVHYRVHIPHFCACFFVADYALKVFRINN
jgi:hypothetical protein